MRSAFDSLVGRAIFVLLTGILTVQLSSHWIYEATLASDAALANQERLVQRLVSMYHTVGHLPSGARQAAVHDLSGGAMDARTGPQAKALPSEKGDWEALRRRLVTSLSTVRADAVLVGKEIGSNSTQQLAMVSLRLPDETWLNVEILAPHFHHERPWEAVLATTLVAALVMLASALMVRWVAHPLQRLAAAARSFHLASSRDLVPEVGPREIRSLAAAFNDMQARILRQTSARTQALAAVSHDLRTPLMRVRLRLEDVSDDAVRTAVQSDLSEMEKMIDATLSYLRGDRSNEALQFVELVALVASIADDASDMGHEVTLDAPSTVVIRGRRLALKRAIANVVQNAVKYGERAEVKLSIGDERALILVQDDGPGVAPEHVDALFEPFVRLEASRNDRTGGFGLGLTIAADIIRAHDGDIRLVNRAEGGLQVEIELPLGGPGA